MATLNFIPLNIAVLTVSDSRTEQTDRSGQVLASLLSEDGHHLAEKQIVADNIYALRAVISKWIAAKEIQVILTTGGTGFTGRDVTPEAVRPLLEKEVPGFSELFRYLSYQGIGTSTIQTRTIAGLVNATLIFCLPGSPGACRDAWQGILREQLDHRHKPCNFVTLLPRFAEK